MLAASLPVATATAAQAQAESGKALESSVGGFNLASVNALLAKGDVAVASGNLGQARKDYDEAREACRRLLGFYRDLSGAFRGLDARIPREMDQKGREALEAQAQASLRAAAAELRRPAEALKVQIKPLKRFWPAENYHQDYAELNKVKYNYYRWACGRDRRLDSVWGSRARSGRAWIVPAAKN